MRIFYAKKNSDRGSSRFRPCPSIVQSIDDIPAVPGTYLAVFADDTSIYATEKDIAVFSTHFSAASLRQSRSLSAGI
jgi:hypothetical protein